MRICTTQYLLMPQILEGQPIVLDQGSGLIKLGYAGDAKPKCVFENIYGSPKYPQVIFSSSKLDNMVGEAVNKYQGLLSLTHPIEHGNIIDTDKMEEIWRYMFGSQQMNIRTQQHPILITEPVSCSYKYREQIAQFFFEGLGVPALTFAVAPVLSLYANGVTTGCVLDSGDGISSAICVYEGYNMAHTYKRSNIAGREVTDYLHNCMFREGHYFSKTSSNRVVNKIKEAICLVSPVPTSVEPLRDMSTSKMYCLPDGTVINIGRSKYMAPEVLFRPILIGEEYLGIHELVYNSIKSVDIELRSTLYKNIILSGGSTLLDGMSERLTYELKLLTSSHTPLKFYMPVDRILSAWKGGSLVCLLDAFKETWTYNKDYQEKGRIG